MSLRNKVGYVTERKFFMTITFTRKGFRAWLEDKKRGAVGMPRSSSACPLAQYLKSEGAVLPRVRAKEYQLHWLKTRRPLPQWARRFIKNVDSQKYSMFIRADQALKELK